MISNTANALKGFLGNVEKGRMTTLFYSPREDCIYLMCESSSVIEGGTEGEVKSSLEEIEEIFNALGGRPEKPRHYTT